MKAELLVVCITKGKEINEQAHFQLYANEARVLGGFVESSCVHFLLSRLPARPQRFRRIILKTLKNNCDLFILMKKWKEYVIFMDMRE
jgi:hypothetical protein